MYPSAQGPYSGRSIVRLTAICASCLRSTAVASQLGEFDAGSYFSFRTFSTSSADTRCTGVSLTLENTTLRLPLITNVAG